MLSRLLVLSLGLTVLAGPALCAGRARSSSSQGSDLRFTDVPREHWAVDYIRRTVNAGLLQGYEGKFLGNSPVNRYQMAQILSRMMDRMGSLQSAGSGGGGDAPSSEIFLQIADEVANLNVAQSSLEEKVVQIRYDLEALKNGEGERERGPNRAAKISPEEWEDRVRTQTPGAIAALAVFASATLLKGLH
jgi:hypothetical protein